MTAPRLRIGFVTNGEPFTGDSPERRPLGGSETAQVQMARSLARRGHEVQVYCKCPAPGVYHGVTYRDSGDLATAAGQERWDVLVVTRFMAALDLPLQAGLRVLWNHDILSRPTELAKRLDQLDICLVLSRYHAQNFTRRLPACAPKLQVTRNGLDLGLIAQTVRGVERRPGVLTYVSRPERGLKLLLEGIWPKLKQVMPDIRLEICGYQVDQANLAPGMRSLYSELDQLMAAAPDVTSLGGLAKADYYRHLASCHALVYPCVFPEISCIAALEAQALGTPIITSDGFALCETVKEAAYKVEGWPGTAEYNREFVKRTANLLTDSATGQLARRAQERVLRLHDWDRIAGEWERLFLARLAVGKARPAQALAANLLLGGDREAATRLLSRGLPEPREGAVPPDPKEAHLLDELQRMITVLRLEQTGRRVAVLAGDGGETAGELAKRLPYLKFEHVLECEAAEGQYDLVLLRDRLEREADPTAFLEQALALCSPDGRLALCVASGAWPLVAGGFLGRRHDLGREDILALLPGRSVAMTYLPRGMVRAGGQAYHLGRWLAVTTAQGPPPGRLDPEAKLRRTRPASPEVMEEVHRAGLM